jgi:hypothetical protein
MEMDGSNIKESNHRDKLGNDTSTPDEAIKKVMKLAFLAIGLVVLLLGYLEIQKWISVNWVTVENQTSTMMTSAAHKAYAVTQHLGRHSTLRACSAYRIRSDWIFAWSGFGICKRLVVSVCI